MKILFWGIGREVNSYVENGAEHYILDKYLIGGIDNNPERRKGTLRG